MTLETLSPNEFLNFIIYDTISATPYSSSHGALFETSLKPEILSSTSVMAQQKRLKETQVKEWKQNLGAQGIKRKRRRKPRVCKNKQEAETQRMTHIAVERNRRKQMNEHLAVLRSIMPESYVQRGDQASIVGGAIEFVKELEHLLQSLEAQKLQLLNGMRGFNTEEDTINKLLSPPPFAQFFVHPQCTWSQMPNKYASKAKASIADIEVTLIETHANLRILSRRRSTSQLFKLVTGFQSLCLTILHINVTTMDLLVLYSISAKLEEECQLTSVDDIAAAVHHMLRIIEEEAVQNAPLV